MNTVHFRLIVSLLGLLCLNSIAAADKAPLSEDALRREAQAIVVGTIDSIRIETEEAAFERGLGNSDWGIYLTLRVESVEDGDVEPETLEARCFRIKSRRSMQEYLSPSGHHPIPDVGTRVRVYLAPRDGSWDVVLPNGIAAAGGDRQSAELLPDAAAVTQLRSLAYTFVLPLEAWLSTAVAGLLMVALMVWLRRRRRR